MEAEYKKRISFNCNISGINRRVDILIDVPNEKYNFTIAEITDVVKEIKQSMKLISPTLDTIRVSYDPYFVDEEFYEVEDDWCIEEIDNNDEHEEELAGDDVDLTKNSL